MQGPVAIDFETTDKDPLTAHAVEVAMYGERFLMQEFIKPPIPIPVETSAIHHIVDSDVQFSRGWDAVKADLLKCINGIEPCVLVAHNAIYEQGIMGEGFENVQWICTYKCALRMYPEAPNHKNETLRYLLGLPDLGRSAISNEAHTAGHDAKVTYQLVMHMLETQSLDTLIKWSLEPKHFPKIPFGKWAGSTWDKIDSGYLQWICKQGDMDVDIKSCAMRELDRRRMAQHAAPRSN